MILNGKDLSARVKDELKGKIDSFVTKPVLAVIMIGDNEASKIYIETKKKACQYVGISFMTFYYDENEKEETIINKIEELNNEKIVSGIIVQLPIPKNFNEKNIINAISPSKDVDGLTEISQGKMLSGKSDFIPCTPKGIIKILDFYNIDITSKHIVIIGRSNLVGKPLLLECLKRNATVTICHSKTKDLEKYTKQADILVSATGKKHIIDKNMIKEGATLIDVGITRENNKIYGDINPNAYEKALSYSPVPGGVGPMTVVMLLENVYEAYKKQGGITDEIFG